MEPITHAQCVRLLAEEPVAHLGVVADDEPYVTAISFVHYEDAIYFRTGPGRRLKALQDGSRVCVEVSRYSTEEGDWESVIAWGSATMVDDPGLEADVIGLLLVKYREVFGSALAFSQPSPLAPEEVVVAVPIEKMTGRASGAGFAPPTKPGRL